MSGLRTQGATWAATYGSVTFNQFGRDKPMTGINEKGLMPGTATYRQACSTGLPGRRSSPTAMPKLSRFHRMPLKNAA